jgi:hypothetical protein
VHVGRKERRIGFFDNLYKDEGLEAGKSRPQERKLHSPN